MHMSPARVGAYAIIASCVMMFTVLLDWPLVAHLVGGWLSFLGYVLPKVRVRLDGIAFFVIGGAVCVVLLQWLMSWFLDARAQALGRVSAVRWRLRHSAAVIALLLMMFVIVTAMAGVTHQVGWLIRSPVVWYSSEIQSDEDNRLSPYRIGRIDPQATGRSWIGDVAPFLAVAIEDVDDKLPWNDPKNVHQYRKVDPNLFNPRVSMPHKSPDGMGLNHFAGNAAILIREKALQASELQMSDTILVGEVNQALEPWGRPGNCRSADSGLNLVGPKKPGTAIGFGSPVPGGVTVFGLLDGSVRELSSHTDPEVLRQLGKIKPPAK